MKKSYIIPLLAFAVCPGALQAKVINTNEARTIATQFIKLGTQPQMKVFKAQGNTTSASTPDFYVFNDKSGNGFVLVAGDDCVSPVIGYSHTGKADINNMPPALKAWLESLSQYISNQRQRNGGVAKTYSAKVTNNPGTPVVEPIVKTHWDQDQPYFNQTPTINGEHTVTCCVATAMAQVFNHYKYPAKGTGTLDYAIDRCDQDRINIDLSKSTYDWDNMLNDYTIDDNGSKNWNDAQATAISTLMRDIGAALHVDYNIGAMGGSGAFSEDIRKVAAQNFGYMATTYYKTNYNMKQWIEMLHKCFDGGNPVVICGATKTLQGDAGHAFVGDGYDSNDNIHINWGWSGVFDGYYNFFKFGPKNYNFNVGMDFTEFTKDESGEAANKIEQPILSIAEQSLIDNNGKETDDTAIKMEADKFNAGISMLAYYISWEKYEGKLKLGLYDKTGNTLLGTVGEEKKLENDARKLTIKDVTDFKLTAKDFADLKDGNYQLVVLSNNTSNDDNWIMTDNDHIFGIEKSEGNIILTLSMRDTGHLTQKSEIRFNKDKYNLSDIAQFSVRIANDSEKDFGGKIFANIKDAETGEDVKNIVTNLNAQVFCGYETDIDGGNIQLVEENNIKPGKYIITLWQYTDGDPVELIDSKPATIIVTENPQKQPKLFVKSAKVNVNGNDIEVKPGDILNINPDDGTKLKFETTWQEALIEPETFKAIIIYGMETEGIDDGGMGSVVLTKYDQIRDDTNFSFIGYTDEDWIGHTTNVLVKYTTSPMFGPAYAKYVGTDKDMMFQINWTNEPTAITNLNSTCTRVVERWNAQGVKLSKAEKGLNIVKYSDGSIRKEIVK